MDTKPTNNKERDAAVFALGRSTNAFHFYLAQAIAISHLPKAAGFHPDPSFFFDHAMQQLSGIESGCVLLTSHETFCGIAVTARRQLDLVRSASFGTGDKYESRNRAHLRRVIATRSLHSRSHYNLHHVENLISECGLRLSDKILSALYSSQIEDDFLKALIPTPLDPDPFSDNLSWYTGCLYSLGISLDQCLHPADVVAFMNLTTHKRIISDDSDALLGFHGRMSSVPDCSTSHAVSIEDSNTWQLLRTFSGGDLKPTELSYIDLATYALSCHLETNIKYDLCDLASLAQIIRDAFCTFAVTTPDRW